MTITLTASRADRFCLDNAASLVSSADIVVPTEVKEAIAWMIRLSSEAVTEDDRLAFKDWIEGAPSRRDAWIDVAESLSPLAVAGRRQERSGMFAERAYKKGTDRRAVLRGLVGFAVLGPAAALITDRFVPLRDVTADHFTRTGEVKTVALDDGSSLVLGARTAIDLGFDASARRIDLRHGEMMVTGRPDPRPISIVAGDLTLDAAGGAFVGRRHASSILLVAIDTPAIVRCRDGRDVRVQSGECAAYDGVDLHVRKANLATETAWVDGMLVANDQTVAYVISRLVPYFVGIIVVAPEVGDRRVTGTFALSDVNRAVDVMAQGLDLSVTRVTPYWLSIGAGRGTST